MPSRNRHAEAENAAITSVFVKPYHTPAASSSTAAALGKKNRTASESLFKPNSRQNAP